MSKREKTVLAAVAIGLVFILALWQMGYFERFRMAQETVGMKVTIDYADGTSRTFDSASQPFGLTIIDPSTGKAVSSIRIELYVTPIFNGPIASYTVSGKLQMQILKGSSVLYDTGQTALSPISPLPTLTSGQAVVISSATATASAIESLYTGWTHGTTYTLLYKALEFSMTITFTDGKSETKSASPIQMSWDFQYQSPYGFSSVSLSFNKVLYY